MERSSAPVPDRLISAPVPGYALVAEKIGISFIGIRPQMGGFYQYALSILEALVDLHRYDLTVFVDDDLVLAQYPNLRHSFRVVQIPKERPSYTRNIARIVGALFGREIAKGAYSVIDRQQCRMVFHPYWGVAAFVTSTPAICTVPDSAPRDSPGLMPFVAARKLDLIIKSIVRKAALIIVESDWGGHLLERHYRADPAKIRVLPLKPPNYLTVATTGESDNADLARLGIAGRYLFLPGRWDDYKNTKRVLHALRTLRESGFEPPLLVLSGLKAHEVPIAEDEIELLGLGGRVVVVGYVPDEMMPILYRNALALVFPTLLGPTSLPVVEAITLGCPVIVPNIPAYPAQAGDAGLVVDPYSVASIAGAIRTIASDEGVENRLRRNAALRGAELRQVNYGELLEAFIIEVNGAR